MLKRSLTLLVLASGLAAAPAFAANRVFIPFADRGGINDWRATNERTIWLHSRTGQWFKAEMLGIRDGLRFAERIAYRAQPDGSFDDRSAVIVGGRACRVQSLVKSDPPPKN